MRDGETESESDTHGNQCQRAVESVGPHHFAVFLVDPDQRVEEEIAGDQRNDRRVGVISRWLFLQFAEQFCVNRGHKRRDCSVNRSCAERRQDQQDDPRDRAAEAGNGQAGYYSDS